MTSRSYDIAHITPNWREINTLSHRTYHIIWRRFGRNDDFLRIRWWDLKLCSNSYRHRQSHSHQLDTLKPYIKIEKKNKQLICMYRRCLLVLSTNFPGCQRNMHWQWFKITPKRQRPYYDFHVATMIYSGKYIVMRNYITRVSTSPEVNQTNWIVGFQFEEAACGSRIDPHPLYDFRWQCYLLPQILKSMRITLRVPTEKYASSQEKYASSVAEPGPKL